MHIHFVVITASVWHKELSYLSPYFSIPESPVYGGLLEEIDTLKGPSVRRLQGARKPSSPPGEIDGLVGTKIRKLFVPDGGSDGDDMEWFEGTITKVIAPDKNHKRGLSPTRMETRRNSYSKMC